MSEMLERAGRAACIASGREPENWLNPHDKELCMRIATAVVRAMRDPPEQYMNQYPPYWLKDADGWYPPNHVRGAIWRSMIDSILSTQPQEER